MQFSHDKAKNYEVLKNFAYERGVRVFGVAPFSKIKFEIKGEIQGNFTACISIGVPLSKAVLDTIFDRPTLVYKHHYKTVNWILDQIAYHMSEFIQETGYNALPIAASQTVDWQNQYGHISHKLVGYYAGCGFIGRSGLLINPQYGPRVRYATILTDLPLKFDEPIIGDCGDCMECVRACPANAISKSGYDKMKCLAKLKEFAKIPGIGVYICGVCIKVCPRGR